LTQAKVFVSNVVDLRTQIREALEFVGFPDYVRADTKVFLKPNLTWKLHLPGVTVSPAFMQALVEVMSDYTRRITIGESNGGYHGYFAEEAFQGHGLNALASRYGVRLVNLSSVETRKVTGNVDSTELSINLPTFLLDDTDVFATVPVPKIHSNTIVSLAFKNQWGCIPDAMRLRLHPNFGKLIVLVNQALRTHFAFFDATDILDVTGPMVGRPVSKNLVVASNHPGAGSVACCRIMGIDPWTIPHHRVALRAGMFPAPKEPIIYNTPVDAFCTHKFHLERSFINWVSYAAFNSSIVTRLIYDSKCADICHDLLYSLRRNQIIANFLYGKIGPPPVEGKRQ
jgi:uncharacterized protein (DUF362 family)